MRSLRIKIAQRIWIGFGLLIIAMIVYALRANISLEKNQKIHRQVTENYSPSILLLKDLIRSVDESEMLTRSWVFIDKNPESKYRADLRLLQDQTIGRLDESVKKLIQGWQADQQKSYNHIYSLIIDSLIPMQHEII